MDITNIKDEWNGKLVDILQAFINICKEYDLHYFCCGGTAIGAVRHHGIIPWDDDIDLLMPRPDYDRLIELSKTEDFGKYEILSPLKDKSYPYYFAKIVDRETTLIEEKERPCVIGLFVDIFPLDGTSDDIQEAHRIKDRYAKLLNRLNAISTHNTFWDYLSLLKRKKEWGRFTIKTAAYFFRPIIRQRLIKEMERLSRLYDYDKAKIVQVYSGSYGHKEAFPKEWLGKGKSFPFEGTTVVLPEEYDKYLRNFFGDYMQLPPKEQRVFHHFKYYLNMKRRETLAEIRQNIKNR